MDLMQVTWPSGVDPRLMAVVFFLAVSGLLALVTAIALVITSRRLANVGLLLLHFFSSLDPTRGT